MEAGEIQVKNPLTGDVFGSVRRNTSDEVRLAVERARAAGPGWEARGIHGRARYLRLWAEALWREQADMVRIIRRETGKNEAGAMLEMIVFDNVLNYYARHAPQILKPKARRTLFPILQSARVYYNPYGVVGFITPWNYPYLLCLMDAAAALVVGNTVVIKPSEITPFTPLRAVEIAHEIGIPQDALQVITGDGSTGAALVDVVDYVSVTGSTATGRAVAKRAAERLIPYSLELGGKDPLIVLDDVDVDLAATSVICGALENAGQVCISTERVYVLARVYDRFVDRLCHYAGQMKIGAGDGLGVHMGSLTNEREVRRCEDQIADAVAKGARVVFGGKRRPDLGPLFFEPTVLVDVNHSMDVMRDETFGPLMPVMRVSSTGEAIRLANDSAYGLSASVFSKDIKRGEAVARQIISGDVSVNRVQYAIGTPSLPTGGRRDSGIGRRNGPEGLLRFAAPQSVLVDRGWFSRPMLTQIDPVLFPALLVARKLRRFIPWILP